MKYVPLLLEEDAEDGGVEELLPQEIHATAKENVTSNAACRVHLFMFVSCCGLSSDHNYSFGAAF
jgi:hypothetical protein